MESYSIPNGHVCEFNYKIVLLEQSTKLKYFENEINRILDNIMSAKNDVIHHIQY